MTELNLQKTSGANMATTIATQLDAQDGKQDGKISAPVWNEFVKDKGGKTIKYSISIENARKSISTYLAKNSQKSGMSTKDLGLNWLFENEASKLIKKETPNKDFAKMFDQKNAEKAKNPEQINAQANMVIDFITGKSETIIGANKNNAADVFLKVLEHFEGNLQNRNYNNSMPLSLGTHLYLIELYPTLINKAKELGIQTSYTKETNFGNNMQDVCKGLLSACRDLAYKIHDKEAGIPSWQAYV